MISNLLKIRGNSICADCKCKKSSWASINIGVFLCIDCAGVHRKFGTHVSRIKSVTLDYWRKDEIEFMENNGNIKINNILEASLPLNFVKPNDMNNYYTFLHDKYVRQKYKSITNQNVAENITPHENKVVENKPVTIQIDRKNVTQYENNSVINKVITTNVIPYENKVIENKPVINQIDIKNVTPCENIDLLFEKCINMNGPQNTNYETHNDNLFVPKHDIKNIKADIMKLFGNFSPEWNNNNNVVNFNK